MKRWWQGLGQSNAQGLARWIVLDIEASGLDAKRDRLISVAAVSVHLPDAAAQQPVIQLADSFEAVLRQPDELGAPGTTTQALGRRPDILIHRIGLGAQAQGLAPVEALLALERFIGNSPVLAFHSGFDQALLERDMRQHLARVHTNPWLDLEHLAAALHKDPRHLSLDAWLKRLGLVCDARHSAIADALVSAELLIKLWPLLVQRKQATWEGVLRVAGEARFLHGRR